MSSFPNIETIIIQTGIISCLEDCLRIFSNKNIIVRFPFINTKLTLPSKTNIKTLTILGSINTLLKVEPGAQAEHLKIMHCNLFYLDLANLPQLQHLEIVACKDFSLSLPSQHTLAKLSVDTSTFQEAIDTRRLPGLTAIKYISSEPDPIFLTDRWKMTCMEGMSFHRKNSRLKKLETDKAPISLDQSQYTELETTTIIRDEKSQIENDYEHGHNYALLFAGSNLSLIPVGDAELEHDLILDDKKTDIIAPKLNLTNYKKLKTIRICLSEQNGITEIDLSDCDQLQLVSIRDLQVGTSPAPLKLRLQGCPNLRSLFCVASTRRITIEGTETCQKLHMAFLWKADPNILKKLPGCHTEYFDSDSKTVSARIKDRVHDYFATDSAQSDTLHYKGNFKRTSLGCTIKYWQQASPPA